MKYKIIVIAALIGLLFSCEREISPGQAEMFMKYYGNYLMDEARDVEVLDDGGYAICGTGSVSDQGKRMVLIITDEYGNMIDGFPKYYTEEGLESGANTIVPIRGGQGGFLLAGYIERPVVGSQDLVQKPVQKDMFLVKVSSTGEESWHKSYGSADDEVILHATTRISSGYMLAGYQVKDGKSDILIMGIYEEGDSVELGLNYNNPYAENGTATYLLNTGEQYLCVCTYDKIGKDGTDILVLNFDDELSPIDKNLTDDSHEYGTCILEDGENNYLVLGNRLSNSGKIEIVVHRIETRGLLITKSVLLATISESNMDLIGERFVKTADGSYAIVGTRQADGIQDIFLQFLTSDYIASGRIIYGATGDQSGADIELPEDGGLVLLGTSSFETNSMISLIKTNDTGDL